MASATVKTTPNPTYFQFANDVLKGVGAKPTKANLAFFSAWFAVENTKAGNNPLATTQAGPPGTTDLAGNPDKVKNYPSYQAGVNATIQTLTNGNYNGLLNSFRRGNLNPVDIAQQNSSELDKWGSGGAAVAQKAKQITGNQGSNSSSSFWGDVWGGVETGALLGPNLINKALGGNGNILGKPINNAVNYVPNKVNQAESSVTTAATTFGMYALYGLALAGGLLLVITGFILIGADIGLAVFEKTRTTQTARRVTGLKNRSAEDQYKSRSYKKPAKEMTTEYSPSAERRKAINERARNAKQDKDIPF